jgi:hypothetical protein
MLESKLTVNINKSDVSSDKVINKALVRVSKICDILTDKFQNALTEYNNKRAGIK